MVVRLLATLALTANAARADGLAFLHADGTRLVDPAGREVLLKGCNLGNWLVLEGWMFGGTLTQNGARFRDGVTVYKTLRDRFGDERAARLIASYRNGLDSPTRSEDDSFVRLQLRPPAVRLPPAVH